MATPTLGATISPNLDPPIEWKTRDSITHYKNKRDFTVPSWLLIFWAGPESGYDGIITRHFEVQSCISLRHNVFEAVTLQECLNKATEWNIGNTMDLSTIPRPYTTYPYVMPLETS